VPNARHRPGAVAGPPLSNFTRSPYGKTELRVRKASERNRQEAEEAGKTIAEGGKDRAIRAGIGSSGRNPLRAAAGFTDLKGVSIMGKNQDAKKAVKKEPVKTVKEKKAAKKVKKEEKKRQQ
jgi:hypothetical protein